MSSKPAGPQAADWSSCPGCRVARFRQPAAVGLRWESALAGIGDALAAPRCASLTHNHDFEFLRYEGRMAIEWLFDAAPGASLGWEADLGWVRRAGEDPMRWIHRYAERLVAVHAKDIAPDGPRRGEDGWCTLGQGIVGWDKLLPEFARALRAIHFRARQSGNYLETLRSSLQVMRSKLT